MARAVVLEPLGALIAQRYRVQATLGRGGMAAVYQVVDERTGKQCALKRCFSREPDKRRRHEALLEREFHTLTQLAHPRIIAVQDYGVDAGGPYYTMELLDGSNLQDIDRLPWQTACVVLRDVASALAILHSRGLVHRDVSMRNVHWTAQGKAKLIDFGAMTTMSVSKDVVGTPPFMAPELLQLQALDARVDLFSLGALGYRLLTGRHAFPAHGISELRDLWRSRPIAPSAIVPDVPADLSALMLRLLTLDRGGRPRSAAEVIERLRGIANLDGEDTAQISRAYLTMPTLVGREAALVAVRRHMLSLVRGDGGVLAVRGASGGGRSRLLDACALEGKLLGAAVVRADARDASSGDWGVARALAQQLFALFPRQAAEAARVSAHVLGHVIEELRTQDATTVTGYAPERALIIRELRDWVLSLSKVQRLLIVVDDLEGIDEPSTAVLSAIAHKAARSPLLLTLAFVDDERRPALNLLYELSHVIEVQHLQPEQTEALLGSVFGDVANLPLCAARIHGLSHGNPRAVMELAQHLVVTGRARYEAGSWVLPYELDESDLPSTLAASLLARVRELSADARELVEALALADEDQLFIASYAALTSHADAKRMFRSLDELVAARILIAVADSYHFAQRGFLSVVREAMSDERRRGLHARIARLLVSRGGNPLRSTHHLLAAGSDRAALDLLARTDLRSQLPPIALLQTAIERAEQLHMPANLLQRLRIGIMVVAPITLDYASFFRLAPVVFKRLEQDSGLLRYRQYADLPEPERLARALSETQQAHLALPENDRAHTVLEAIRELARLLQAAPGLGLSVFDLDMLEALPSLQPLASLSPGLPLVEQFIEGSKEWVRGRMLRSRAIYMGALDRISQSDRGGLDELQHMRARLGLEFGVGVLEASYGMASAEERAKVLEQNRVMRVNAWRVRSLQQLALGNTNEADKCRRRASLLEAQLAEHERYLNSTAGIEMLLRSRLGDVLGVKAQLEAIAALAAEHPGWRPVEFLGRSRFCELQGDLSTALELAVAGLELARPLRHSFFSPLAASHITLLAEVGRLEESVELARHYTDVCRRAEISIPDVPLRAALVLARVGHCDEAVEVLTPLLEQVDSLGREGLACSMVYEARARVAIYAQDARTFQRCAVRCVTELEKAHNPALHAQFARLVDEARERGLLPGETATAIRQSLKPVAAQSEYDTIQSRMAECVDQNDRARCALTLLLQQAISRVGYLYGTREAEQLHLLAALPDAPIDPGVAAWVQRYAQSSLTQPDADTISLHVAQGSSDAQTASDANTASETGPATGTATADEKAATEALHAYTDADGRQLEAVLLHDGAGRRRALVAVLVVEAVPAQRVYLSAELVSAIARELLDHRDAVGWRAV